MGLFYRSTGVEICRSAHQNSQECCLVVEPLHNNAVDERFERFVRGCERLEIAYHRVECRESAVFVEERARHGASVCCT